MTIRTTRTETRQERVGRRLIAYSMSTVVLASCSQPAAATESKASLTTAGSSDSNSEPSTASTSVTATGLRTVSFHGVALDVPQSWSTNATRCGIPTENTVVIGNGMFDACGLSESPAVASVLFEPLFSGYVPRFPPALGTDVGEPSQLEPRPTESDPGESVAVGSVPATRWTSEPTSNDPFYTVTYAVEPNDAAVVIRAPEAGTVAAIDGSLRLEDANNDGCATRSEDDLQAFPPPAGPERRPGAAAALVPDEPSAITVCRYVHALLVQSGKLTGDVMETLLAAMNGAPQGTTRPPGDSADCTFTSSDVASPVPFEQEYRVLVEYDDGEPLVVVVRQGLCGPLGLSNGSRTVQLTGEVAGLLGQAAGDWGSPPEYLPNP